MPTNAPLITIEDVVEATHANWSNLQRDQKYKLEHLVGKVRWQVTQKGHRTQLGIQFKALALGGVRRVPWAC